MEKERRDLLKELLVEFPCDAPPLSASSFELLRRDPDVLHVAAQHEVNLGAEMQNVNFLTQIISVQLNLPLRKST